MASPFRRHQQQVRAQQSAGGAAPADAGAPPELPTDSAAGHEYAALRVLLHDNLRRLSDIASIEARNPIKAEMARAFDAWIEGVLIAGETGGAAQDEIVVTNMIWAIDYRDFDYALRIAAHVLRYGLVLPERYNRTAACFLGEEIAELSLHHQAMVSHEQLLRVLALVDGFDMPDPARAKLHKAIGRSYVRKAEAFDPAADNAPAGGKAAYTEQAIEQLKRALALDPNVGVKTDIRTLERQLKALTEKEPKA
jgi:Phage small terminase subunit